jgi:hypothetical protein
MCSILTPKLIEHMEGVGFCQTSYCKWVNLAVICFGITNVVGQKCCDMSEDAWWCQHGVFLTNLTKTCVLTCCICYWCPIQLSFTPIDATSTDATQSSTEDKKDEPLLPVQK